MPKHYAKALETFKSYSFTLTCLWSSDDDSGACCVQANPNTPPIYQVVFISTRVTVSVAHGLEVVAAQKEAAVPGLAG
jgi:hypothetical protein